MLQSQASNSFQTFFLSVFLRNIQGYITRETDKRTKTNFKWTDKINQKRGIKIVIFCVRESKLKNEVIMQHKMVAGYLLLMAVIGCMVAIVLHECKPVAEIEQESVNIF